MQNKNVLKSIDDIFGVIHNHPWTGRYTDLEFSVFIPFVTKKATYDRNIIDEDENEYITFYLYAPNGLLWVDRGKDRNDPYDQHNRFARIIAEDLPWDPLAHVSGTNPTKMGPYNKKWHWRKDKDKDY